MSTDSRDDRLARRIEDLYASDPQFADARPSDAITALIDQPGLTLQHIIQTVMEGYADRPALGQRAVRFVNNPGTGRTCMELLSRFETVTYRELLDRADAIAHGLTGALTHPLRPGDRVAVLGVTSVDYTTLDIALIRAGAVPVPLQTNAAVTTLGSIAAETQPSMIASSAGCVADAVELALTGYAPARLVVFDYHSEADEHREAVEAARTRLADLSVVVETLADVLERGNSLPAAPALAAEEHDPLALLLYTSGSTGAPKGAMYTERLVANFWRNSGGAWFEPSGGPSITLNFMPMSHVVSRFILFGTLAHGGTAYFAAKSDLSTFLEDLALVRPTELAFVPRVWEMLLGEFQSELDQRAQKGGDQAALEAEVMAKQRQYLLGGRFISASTVSAPISPELRTWVESLLDLHLADGYGSTETGIVIIDGQVRRPAVDYKLVDVPDLGYFATDRPHPRGELLVKAHNVFPGYYKRPEVTAGVFDPDGYYCTGDIMAEAGPGRLRYVDRRNNVLKLANGEFVTLAKLEAVFGNSPLVRQVYVYGNSARSCVLAVIVPARQALSRWPLEPLKPLISESLQDAGRAAGLQSYEFPGGFLIETTPFTVENGLLTGIRKLAWPKLREHYGEQLEQLYDELAESQATELRELRRSGAGRPVSETISRAAAALLGIAASDLASDARFIDLGADSLSALTFTNLLREIYDIDVPVGVIVSPATDVQALADYIEAERAGSKRPTFANVHGRDAIELRASDLTLDKFLDASTLAAAPALPRPSAVVHTILLTGATGFLGRYLALEWLERLALTGGKLIALVRAKDDASARERLDQTFDSGDPVLLTRYRELAAGHLEVLAGDKGEASLGLEPQTWQRLADTVDLIVDPAALVNHVLPYSELFGPNVAGTAELVRIALTTKIKAYTYVSTAAVGDQIEPSQFTEDADIRVISPARKIDNSPANGYVNSKWGGELLLRQAHDLCGLPVTVFRCSWILAGTTYAGQLNLPDTPTRLILSLAAAGIAPGSFYELPEGPANGNLQQAHFGGLPVEFIAEAISTLGAQAADRFQTYHVWNPDDDGIGLDEYVDWLIDAGYSIQRIPDYAQWLQRFETILRALPDRQRQHSLLPLLHSWQQPQQPARATSPADQFRSAVQEAKISPDKDIPHVTREVITKYITDLRLLGLL